MNSIGDNINIVILFPNSVKVRGTAVVSEVNYTQSHGEKIETGVEYTIPNMHVKFEGTKVVEEFTSVPDSGAFMGLASQSWFVDKPLTQVVE